MENFIDLTITDDDIGDFDYFGAYDDCNVLNIKKEGVANEEEKEDDYDGILLKDIVDNYQLGPKLDFINRYFDGKKYFDKICGETIELRVKVFKFASYLKLHSGGFVWLINWSRSSYNNLKPLIFKCAGYKSKKNSCATTLKVLCGSDAELKAVKLRWNDANDKTPLDDTIHAIISRGGVPCNMSKWIFRASDF